MLAPWPWTPVYWAHAYCPVQEWWVPPWAVDAGAEGYWVTRGRTHSPSAGRKPEARVPAALSAVASSRRSAAGETRRQGLKRRAGSAEHDRKGRSRPPVNASAGAGRTMPFALDLTTEHRPLGFTLSRDENSVAPDEIGTKSKKRKIFGRGVSHFGCRTAGLRLTGRICKAARRVSQEYKRMTKALPQPCSIGLQVLPSEEIVGSVGQFSACLRRAKVGDLPDCRSFCPRYVDCNKHYRG